jgi:hypothetical protein
LRNRYHTYKGLRQSQQAAIKVKAWNLVFYFPILATWKHSKHRGWVASASGRKSKSLGWNAKHASRECQQEPRSKTATRNPETLLQVIQCCNVHLNIFRQRSPGTRGADKAQKRVGGICR